MTLEDKNKLLAQLEALKIFPNNKLVRSLRDKITKKLERLEIQQIKEQSATTPSNEEINLKANLSRSSKLKKHHRYIRLIRDNFPDLTYSTIRKQLKERKQGQEVSIPDVIWQNPSP